MNEQNKAKQYLKYVRDLGLEIKAKLELCEQLRELAAISSPTLSFDKISGGNNNKNRLEEHVVKILTIEGDIKHKTYRLADLRNDAVSYIDKMEEPRDRALLMYRYINAYSWENVAEEMNYSLDHTKGYAHKRALNKFSDIFNINTK